MSVRRFNTLQIDREAGWLTIWLNRPQARNALSEEMVEDLLAVLHDVAPDRTIRGVTFRGKGGVFCAGGDLKGFAELARGEANALAAIEQASLRAGELFAAIHALPQVTVMLVEGAAMAGGLGMVCAGDLVAVTRDARFAFTEVTLGIPPAQIAPYAVARLGGRQARRLMLTAARFDGLKAGEIGLADAVVETVEALGLFETSIRKSVMRCGPEALAATKDVILKSGHLSGDAMRTHYAKSFAACLASEEGREGVAAFIEKRKPRWAEDGG